MLWRNTNPPPPPLTLVEVQNRLALQPEWQTAMQDAFYTCAEAVVLKAIYRWTATNLIDLADEEDRAALDIIAQLPSWGDWRIDAIWQLA